MKQRSIVGIVKIKDVLRKDQIKSAFFNILEELRETVDLGISPKSKIMIKVNICLVRGYETGTTVDPFLVKCFAEWMQIKYNPEIIYVGEADASVLDVDIAFKALGWVDEFKDMTNVELVNLAKDEIVNLTMPDALYFKELKLSRKYIESDFLISFAKLKTNNICGITCILKNQFGITTTKNKSQYHANLTEAIIDLNRIKKPGLCIVDGLIAMEGEGPVDGIPKSAKLIIVGNDPVATDHACARIMKTDIGKIPYMKLAVKNGLGSTTYLTIGEKINEVSQYFQKPSSLLQILLKVIRSALFLKMITLFKHKDHKFVPGNNRLKVGIIGLGAISDEVHLPILNAMDSVEIVAASETDLQRRNRRKQAWNIPFVYETYSELFENTALDAVFVCVPNDLHYDVVKSALEHKLHVFCEKPLGLSAEKAMDLANISQKKNLILTVGYNRLFQDGFLAAVKVIKSGKCGKILQINGTLVNAGPYAGWAARSDWFLTMRSGGVIYDSGSHLLSIINNLLPDRIVEVSANSCTTYHLTDVSDQVAGQFRTEGGILGTFNIGWRSAADTCCIKVIGTAGSLTVDNYGIELKYGSYGPLERIASSLRAIPHIIIRTLKLIMRNKIDRSYYLQIEEFVNSINYRESQPLFKIGEAVNILAILNAIEESIATGNSVRIRH